MQQDEKPYSWLLLSWPQIIRQETVRLNHLSPIPMTLDQQVQVVHVRRRHRGRGRVRSVGGGRCYRCCCGVRVSPRDLIKRQMNSYTSFYYILNWISILVCFNQQRSVVKAWLILFSFYFLLFSAAATMFSK